MPGFARGAPAPEGQCSTGCARWAGTLALHSFRQGCRAGAERTPRAYTAGRPEADAERSTTEPSPPAPPVSPAGPQHAVAAEPKEPDLWDRCALNRSILHAPDACRSQRSQQGAARCVCLVRPQPPPPTPCACVPPAPLYHRWEGIKGFLGSWRRAAPTEVPLPVDKLKCHLPSGGALSLDSIELRLLEVCSMETVQFWLQGAAVGCKFTALCA